MCVCVCVCMCVCVCVVTNTVTEVIQSLHFIWITDDNTPVVNSKGS